MSAPVKIDRARDLAIRLRRATRVDSAAIAALYLASRKTHVAHAPLVHSDKAIHHWIREHLIPGSGVTVAVCRGIILGMSVVSRDETCGWIDQLYVDPQVVGRGIGTRLLIKAKAELGAPLRLYTFQASSAARRFYERHGFRAIHFSDGSQNEENCPDVLYEWRT